MTAVAKIHDALREIDPVVAHVHESVDVDPAHNFASVNAHANGESALGLELFRQLNGALDCVCATTKESQGHAVAGRAADNSSIGRRVCCGRQGRCYDESRASISFVPARQDQCRTWGWAFV